MLALYAENARKTLGPRTAVAHCTSLVCTVLLHHRATARATGHGGTYAWQRSGALGSIHRAARFFATALPMYLSLTACRCSFNSFCT